MILLSIRSSSLTIIYFLSNKHNFTIFLRCIMCNTNQIKLGKLGEDRFQTYIVVVLNIFFLEK